MAFDRSNRDCLTALLVLSALALGGCTYDPWKPDDPFPRVPVAGSVTLDGAPVPAGMIQFEPAAETKGPTAAGEISGGHYAIEKAQGPIAGKYKVLISGRPPARLKPGEPPGGTPKLTPEPVPAKYNTESTLKTEVPAEGSTTLDFALKKS
jgi:hypothetical protein